MTLAEALLLVAAVLACIGLALDGKRINTKVVNFARRLVRPRTGD